MIRIVHPGTEPHDDAVFEAMAQYLDGLEAVSFLVALDRSRWWISASCERTYGGSRHELAADPHTALALVHPDDVPLALEFRATLQELAGTRNGPSHARVPCTFRLRSLDGSYRWNEVSCNVVGTTDGSRFLVGTAVDVTALRDARSDLATLALAEDDANRTTAEFVSKMSHEMRTPLHAILGYAQLLEMGAGEPAEYLSRLRRAGDHVVQLLDDLLDFSRMNASRLTVNDDIVDVHAEVDGAIEMVSALARAHEVTIAYRDDTHARVRADATRLRQVLVNLLSNAIKYNRGGGSVTITTSTVDDDVHVDVEDTGSGIAPDLLGRVFVPFDRMGAESTGVAGAGLGLPLTDGLVRAMGGTVEVTSALGAGTRFRVVLRRARAESPTEVRDVVCIDDDPESRRILEAVLSRMPGANVLLAGTGVSGLALLERVRPSLVVLDRHLPDRDADTMMQEVARVAPGCPVVLVSSDPEMLAARFVRPPVVAAFAKPLDLEVFVAAVARTWSMRPA